MKVVEKIKTHIIFGNFFSPENRDICEITWGTTGHTIDDSITGHRKYAFCMSSNQDKNTDTHSKCTSTLPLSPMACSRVKFE
jgi:hypothetical protein